MLQIKKSRIPNAGKGLFTTSRIRKGDIIVRYEGDRLTWDQCLKRYGDKINTASYLYYISNKNCIDAQNALDAFARYANDATGFSIVKGLTNNAEYQNIKGTPYLVATKDIPAFSEIYADYSGDYWEVMKQEQKEREEKELREKKKTGEKTGKGNTKAKSTAKGNNKLKSTAKSNAKANSNTKAKSTAKGNAKAKANTKAKSTAKGNAKAKANTKAKSTAKGNAKAKANTKAKLKTKVATKK